MPKLIEGFADKLHVPPGKRDVLVFDDEHKDAVPGFGIRKFASGKATYFIKYNVGGRQRKQSLGAVTRGNLKAMRLLASEVKARARLGQDLIAEKKAAEDKPKVATLGQVVPGYLAVKKPDLRARSYLEVKRHLEKAWKPLHKHAVDAISRAEIVGIVDHVEHNSGPVAADRAKTSLSGLFAWAIADGYAKDAQNRRLRLEANPCINIDARSASKRSRVLSEGELVEIWKACLDDDYGRIIRLLILCGQRRTEIGSLAWPEVDLSKRQIDFPGVRTRNGKPHIVPLSDGALAILAHVNREGSRDYIFGRGTGGFSGWSKAKAELDARVQAAREVADIRKPMPAWVLHDLRRSFVTHINERGFAQPHVVKSIVNHISGHLAGVAGVYNKAQYLAERRQALALWGEHVNALVDGRQGTVVALKRA